MANDQGNLAAQTARKVSIVTALSTAESVAAQVDRLVRRDLRWCDAKTGERISVRESLIASCERGMRNIDRAWWDILAARIGTMSDMECEDALHEIEDRCAAAIAEMRQYQ